MKRQILIGLSILLAAAGFASADKLPYKRGELLVRFADTGAGASVRKTVAGPLSNRAVKNVISNLAVAGTRVAKEYDGITPGLAVVRLPEGAKVADALGRFNLSPGVLYAQPNYVYKLAAIPNDLYFSLLWNMEQIDAPAAWDIETSGIGAIVAVTDTGIEWTQSSSEIDGHDDLFVFDDLWLNDDPPGEGEDMPIRGELDVNDVNGVDDDGNLLEDDLIGADFGGAEVGEDDPDGDPSNADDDDGHGTHVTGIIGAVGNNGIGVAGVCWRSRIMHLKIFADDYVAEESGALTFDIIRAIDYAIEHNAKIINASWGAYEIELDQLLYGRIRDARDAGILFVAAAGNGDDEFGFPVDTDFMPFYPASYDLDNIISVMATDACDSWASSYSNYGFETVDIAAPGGDDVTGIYSTVPEDDYEDEEMFGTSFAAPHVSGAAALMWTLDPSLTYDIIKKLLFYSSDKLPGLQGLCASGGRLNLYRAVKMAKGGRVRNTKGTPDPADDTFKPTIHASILSATNGDELIAKANSWYIEDVDFGSKQITLRSGDIDNPSDQTVYPHNTYISGAFDPGSSVVKFTGVGPGTVLKGFTILDGSRSGIYCNNASPIIEDCIITRNTDIQGGGVYCTNNSAPTIIDCDITNNTALDSGGGIYCSDSDADIIDCTIRNNNAGSNDGGGIYCGSGSDADITNTTISNNTADKKGGGIYVDNSSPTINGCEITGNTTNASGGGIYCENSSGADIINTTVSNNTTKYWGGGIYCDNSSGMIKNCLIINNRAISWDGGGIYLEKSSPAIANCTIANNAANENAGVGGGLCCFDSSDPDITDCIFAGNQRYAIANYYQESWQVSEPHLRYSLFYNNSEGDYVIYDDISSPPVLTVYTGAAELNGIAGNSNNIEDAPMFVRGRLGDYYLSQGPAGQILFDPDTGTVLGDANSPAVDAGSDTAAAVGMNLYSTRTDTVVDAGIVDIGYHYDDPVPMQYYDLTAFVTPSGWGMLIPSGTSHKQYAVVLLKATAYDEYQFKSWYGTDDDAVVQLDPEGWFRGIQYNVVTMDSDRTVIAQFETILVQLITSVSGEGGTISPSTHRPRYYRRGGVVDLYATPSDLSHAIIWTGTDDDYSILRYNTVTMVAPFTEGPDGGDAREVNVEFYAVQTLYYPGDGSYPILQAAIDAAHARDIIVVAESNEPYVSSWGYEIWGKAITITSARPDDPCCVAKTVFTKEVGEEGTGRSAFAFVLVGRNTILKGVTLEGWSGTGLDGLDGDDMDDANDGAPGGDAFGGAIYCIAASPTIKNCVIVDCNIQGGDGGEGQSGDDDHPDGFNGGFPGRAYGGGLACLSGGVFMPSSPLVVNCTFNNCSVAGGVGGDGGTGNDEPWGYGGKGGGYYYSPWYVYTPWEFEGWGYDDDYSDPARYSGRGGAVYVGEYCAPIFIGCTFNSNFSQGGSNGICGLSGDPPSLRDEPSIHWRIDNMGGAVYCGVNSEAEFVDCVFTDNYADVNLNLPEDEDYNNNDSFTGFGGAVGFDKGAKVTFENCIFYDNYASVGGAIYGTNSDPIIADCTVTDNEALHGGGALLVGGTPKIARSTFNLNLANESGGQGGAICSLGANAEITDCNIVDNDAAESGGGIYISSQGIDGGSAGDGTLFIRNCLITQNSAFRDGGGISTNWHSDPNIVNCTIKDNTVTSSGGWGGGLFCSYGNYTNVLNSIIWNNSADYGAQIAVATSSEYDPRPSTVNVSYSDVKGGAAGVFLDNSPGANCELIWDYSTNLTGTPGTPDSEPLFVSGYFLSQPDTNDPNQTELSPCVDAGGSGDEYWDAYWFGMYRHTTRTDGVPDVNRVDMGYHYVLAADIIGDYNFDGVVDFNDYRMFLWHWLEKDCDFPDWCFGADLNQDGIVNFKDDALFKLNYGEVDTTPPIPDPMTWAVAPAPGGEGSITMRATTAFDNSGHSVEYYFENVTVTDHNSGWQDSPTYTDSGGLTAGVEYGYRVKAHDTSTNRNETGWSVIGYAITGEGAYGTYYGVICGIANYNDPLSDLYWTVNGAANLYRSLAHSANWNPQVVSSPENIILLSDSSATKAGIQSAIQDMAANMSAYDAFLFYYSGHGSTGSDIDPIDEADGIDEYLFTYGATFDIEGNPQNAIRDDELGDWLAALPTDNYIVILDTCFSGGHAMGEFASMGLGDNVPAEGDGFAEDLLQMQAEGSGDDGVAPMDVHDNGVGMVLAAAAEGESAWESPELEYGVFTYYLLEGMDGIADQQGNTNDWVSGEESYDYLAALVSTYVAETEGIQQIEPGAEQNPQIYDANLAEEFEFLSLQPVNPGFPASPSTLIAMAASSSQIDLLWLDRADNENGFEIERRIEDAAFVQLATVGADVEEYSDTNLAELTTYTYRVRAYNGAGNSPFSREAYATTLAVGEDPNEPNEPPPPDNQPPLPNPSEWLIPPYMYETSGTRYHSMTAVEAFEVDTGGNDPVWYYFECVNGNGTDSGWQLSPIYNYPHPSHCVYVVRTRDNVGNVGQDSAPAYTGD